MKVTCEKVEMQLEKFQMNSQRYYKSSYNFNKIDHIILRKCKKWLGQVFHNISVFALFLFYYFPFLGERVCGGESHTVVSNDLFHRRCQSDSSKCVC